MCFLAELFFRHFQSLPLLVAPLHPSHTWLLKQFSPLGVLFLPLASSTPTPVRTSLCMSLSFPPVNTLPGALVTSENSFQTCLLEIEWQIKNFFIKIRHFRGHSVKTPRIPSVPLSGEGPSRKPGLWEGLRPSMPGFCPFFFLTQNSSPLGQGEFEPDRLLPSFLVAHC